MTDNWSKTAWVDMQYIYIHPSYFLCGINFYFNPTTTGGGLNWSNIEIACIRDPRVKCTVTSSCHKTGKIISWGPDIFVLLTELSVISSPGSFVFNTQLVIELAVSTLTWYIKGLEGTGWNITKKTLNNRYGVYSHFQSIIFLLFHCTLYYNILHLAFFLIY